jgi:hypothetical protein
MLINLSTLPHTWIFDIDGTICVHNGYKSGEDKVLPGVRELFAQIPKDDYILLLTARDESVKQELFNFLKCNNIRYNQVLFGLPFGERILINDRKPSGLVTAFSYSPQRDQGLRDLEVVLNPEL